MEKKKPTVLDFWSWFIGGVAALGLCCYAAYILFLNSGGMLERILVLIIGALALWSDFWFISVAWRELRRCKLTSRKGVL